MKGKRRGALIRCIAFLLCACFFAALMPAAPAKAAAKNQGTLANLVICIRFSDSDDAHDIFANAEHWEKVMGMYDTADDSFKNYIKAISDQKLTINNIFHTTCGRLPAFSPFRGLLPMDKAAAKRGEILQRTGKPALFPHIP